MTIFKQGNLLENKWSQRKILCLTDEFDKHISQDNHYLSSCVCLNRENKIFVLRVIQGVTEYKYNLVVCML
jgi:hypothetical protein